MSADPPNLDRAPEPLVEAAPESGPEAVAEPGAAAPSASPARPGRRTGVAIVAMSLIAVLAGGALFLSGWTLGRQTAMTPGTPADETQLFQPFWDTYRAVTDRYAGGDVDRKALVEGAIKGMIGALDDPYSQYLTSEEFKKSLQGISGEFEGIGATIGTVDGKGATSGCAELGPDCHMVIVAPIRDAPAEKAGLLPGDVVTKIDGAALDGLTLEEARSRVRGAKGTTVVLTIERGGTTRDIEVTRAVIVTPEVESKDLANGTVGYVKLSGFSDHAAEEFDRVIAEDVKAGRTKLIVDLRGNPGGFVTAARDIASQFLADGTIFWQEDADGSLIETRAKPRRLGGRPDDRGGPARGWRVRLGVGDRRRRAARSRARDPRRREDLRQGHGPAVDPARGRQRRVPPHHRQVADPGQDLDPRQGDRARCARRGAASEARRRPGSRRGTQGAGR